MSWSLSMIFRVVPCHVCHVAVVQAKVPVCMLVAREQRFVVSLFLDLQRFVESRCSVITNPGLKPCLSLLVVFRYLNNAVSTFMCF